MGCCLRRAFADSADADRIHREAMRDVQAANIAARRSEAQGRVRHAADDLRTKDEANPLRRKKEAPLTPLRHEVLEDGHEEVKHADMIDFLETDQFELRPVDAMGILSGHASLT